MLGEVIHGYRVDQALSADKGGFGDVFFATHVDSGAEAVVKVLKPEMSAHHDIVARFFNEARAAASVHHPGIVQIHNVGYHGDRAYLLMERLHGDDLETRLQGGPLPVDRALVFVRQAAGAVGAAHDRGIVHRDLKPANLFVVSDPDVVGGERVKVLDFGIAKLTVDAGAGKTQGVFGTPAYMSPEQCASTGAVDARADLYSLGCIFYELVCGRPPFGQGGLELIASHLRDPPTPPRALAPWVPPAIEQIILCLLEKQPAQRYPTCAALIAALDHAAAAVGLAGMSSPHLPMAPTIAARARTGTAPASTTLGASAGADSVPPARPRGRTAWLAGCVAVVGAAAVVVVLALRGTGREPAGAPPPPPGDAAVAIVGVLDAAAAIAAPDAAVATAAAMPGDAALADGGAHTEAVAVVVPPRAEALDAGPAIPVPPPVEPAAVEPEAQLIHDGDQAFRAKRYGDAIAAYRGAQKIGADPAAHYGEAVSLFYEDRCGEAHEALQPIENIAVAAPLATKVKALRRSIDACVQRLVDSANAPTPARDACDPGEVNAVLSQADQQYRAGYARAALALLRRALPCKQDVRMVRLAVLYACEARDSAAAREYFPRVPARYQGALEQACQQQGIAVRP